MDGFGNELENAMNYQVEDKVVSQFLQEIHKPNSQLYGGAKIVPVLVVDGNYSGGEYQHSDSLGWDDAKNCAINPWGEWRCYDTTDRNNSGKCKMTQWGDWRC